MLKKIIKNPTQFTSFDFQKYFYLIFLSNFLSIIFLNDTTSFNLGLLSFQSLFYSINKLLFIFFILFETVASYLDYYGLNLHFIKLTLIDIKNLNYGQNIRSSEHLNIYEKKPFNQDHHKKYLEHEKIENLSGLEIDLVYEWEVGSMLIFDRTRLHCSSSLIEGKKIGLTTFTKK